MDWITLSIESIGLIILILWTIVPIQEFKVIFHRLREQRRNSGNGSE
jgi:hypothetical protein